MHDTNPAILHDGYCKSSSNPAHIPHLKYLEAAKKVNKACNSEPLQSTDHDDDSDNECPEEVQVTSASGQAGEQTMQHDSHLEALAISYIDFNCTLLSKTFPIKLMKLEKTQTKQNHPILV